MLNNKLSLFGRIDWTSAGVRTLTIEEVIAIIRDGGYIIDDSKRSGMTGTLKEATLQIQSLPDGTDLQSVKKQFLPAVSFNGVYNNGIRKYSSYTALDFDHIPSLEIYNDLYRRLSRTQCVAYVYRTPSGKGLKALVLHDNTDPGMHGNLYQQLLDMFQTPYVKTDSSCRDLSRRNYICYDPGVWTNPSPVPYHFVYDTSLVTRTPTVRSTSGRRIQTSNRTKPAIPKGSPSDASIMSLLKYRCRNFILSTFAKDTGGMAYTGSELSLQEPVLTIKMV